MNKILKAAMAISLAAIISAPASTAQFSKFLKKAQKTVEQVTKPQDAKEDRSVKAAAMAMANGGTIENPLADAADIELVGAYGKSTSTNYGTVYLVFKVNMKLNKSIIAFCGTEGGAKTMAVDYDGNSYFTDSMASQNCDVTEGIPVKVKVDGRYQHFQDVKKSAKGFQVMKVSVYIDAAHRGQVTMRDVPIQWDVTPD